MNREFKNKPREEMESWREMFERCTTERQEKLNKIKVLSEAKVSTFFLFFNAVNRI